MKALFIVLSLAMIAGCSSGDGGGSSSGNEAAKNRWPEKGSFKSSFTYNGCTDKYEFDNKADYCLALTDESLSNCNTQSQRASTYRVTCGDDFAPRNFVTPSMSGYDDYLKKSCSIESKRHETIPALCSWLANESVHAGCFWSNRKQSFNSYNCQGEFSPRPVVVTPPKPTATPSQGDDNEPTNPPEQPKFGYDLLVYEYNQIGIEVTLQPIGGINLPGEKSFNEKVRDLVPVMLELKPWFADRKSAIKKIQLTEYTSYMSQHNHLSLDAGFSRSDIEQYLVLHDQRQSITNSTGIKFSMGIDVYGHETGDKFAMLKKRTEFLKKNSSAFQKMSPFLKALEIGSYGTFDVGDGELKLGEKKFAEEFEKMKPLVISLASLSKLGVKFKGLLFDDAFNSAAELTRLFDSKSKEFVNFNIAIKGLTIEFGSSYDSAPYYTGFDKTLKFFIKSKPADTKAVEDLLSITPIISALNATLEVDSYELDETFKKAVKLLLSRESAILKKKEPIKTIRIGRYDSSFSTYSGLTIGAEGGTKSLDKALATIN